MATKSKIKADYLANLQETYPFYFEGSRPLSLANEAIDAALNGTMKLKGASFDKALKDNGINPKSYTLKQLAALPD